MINFTVGPVMSQPEVLNVASVSTPYFRTLEFSKLMFDNESIMLEFLNAPKGSRCVFLTTSGTGAMESCVMNVLNDNDKIICINGGAFGQRFVDLCKLHQYKYTEVKCRFGAQLDINELDIFENCGYTAMLVNMHETSSGILYNMREVSEFCKRNNILLIVDAISAFIADKLDMSAIDADVVIASSQKALAVQPGISIVALSPSAIGRVDANNEKCMYLSLKEALKNMERGQTPFTPAVTTLMQINKRLNWMKKNGGVQMECQKIYELAVYFRGLIQNLPLKFVVEKAEDRSNAVTAVRTDKHTATNIFNILKDEYSMWICPNGGIYKDDVFRVGHIGYLTKENYDELYNALKNIYERGYM